MRSIRATSRVPFAVSLTLIFSYGLLQAVVPPTIFGTQDMDTPLATTPSTQPTVKLVTQAEREEMTDRAPRHSIR